MAIIVAITFMLIFYHFMILGAPTNLDSSTTQQVHDDLLRNLKRGLFSADSVLYHTRDNIVQSWVKQDQSIEHTPLFEVITQLSVLMTTKETLMEQQQQLVEALSTERLFELNVATLLVDAVMEDACNWLTHVLTMDSFNCSEQQIKTLVAEIRAQQSIDKIKNALKDYKKLKGVGSCDWIRCKFWCSNGNETANLTSLAVNAASNNSDTDLIEYLREYNDVACNDFTQTDCNTCM